MLTFEEMKELIEMVAKHRLEGVSIERAGFRLEISGSSPAPPALAAPIQPAIFQTAAAAAPAPTPVEAIPEPEEVVDEHADAHILQSPIVGTYYESPSPDSPAFVKVGDRVEEGQVLCIVEAMKIMNEIESDVSGEIVGIYPKNAQPVEFDEPLFAIK